MASDPPPSNPAAPPAASGLTGEWMDAPEWAASALGPPGGWPPDLKAVAGLVMGSNIPMLVAWGPDLRVVHNESYGDLLGDRRPAQGKPFAEIWADQWDVVGVTVERVLSGETVYEEAVPRLLHRHGRAETAWLTFSSSPLRDESGAICGLFGVVTAVSSDARTERRLRESEERFRLIADSAPALMWVTKLDRKRSFVNRAYVDFLGITYEQAVDFDWRTVLHPDDQARVVRESIAGEASLQAFTLEARYRRHDGAWRWVRSISQPRWGPGGEHAGFIGVAIDITDAKEAEAALRDVNETLERRVEERTADLRAALDRLRQEIAERERAEEALRQAQKMEAVGQLTGGIAHDFNNLLTPVIGGLEMLVSRLDDPKLKRLASGALESSRRGAKLTGQLLTFSRMQRISIAPVAVNRVLDNLRPILRHTLGSRVAVELRPCPQAAHALCDENQLENAILNLAINARDAMPEGGTLVIGVELRTEPAGPDLNDGDYVCLTVADTGIGMTPEVAARAAEPFFSTKPFGKGTGLGLAQVYGIARQSGGTMRIDSREGHGTTVRLLLPRADTAADAAQAEDGPAEAAEPGAAARILIVDDDGDVRQFLGDLLEEMGHSVTLFESPEKALAGDLFPRPDLALLDFAMPGMNGAQLARALRERHPDLPVVFVTGYAESDQIEHNLGSDVPVLRKPFGFNELSNLVRDALSGAPAAETA
ncbi:hybrid sensor histidine kinase/response regulator [Sphingosinicella terrae]|uniref:hybrid sensor histidine kinase/response regulator n=1 Tax=Sphingosinicella terrae TaxID=2172047 RepID=UPI000E0D1589|nr:PAS domain-containing sensor histidine kinase [Sphingosinicella terrae]